jgi:anti-anti-sigma factor
VDRTRSHAPEGAGGAGLASFTIRRAGSESAPVLHVSGELDFFCVEELRTALEEFTADAGEVVVDLRQLEYVDSSAVRCLIRASRHREATGSRLICVARRGGTVRRVLDLVAGELLEIREVHRGVG